MAAKKNFPLRLDPKLHQALEQWAEDEFRSVNGHIEYLLREALLRSGRLPKASAAQQTNEELDN
ncbi:toxin-antitoxin system HicB family antitoxin [Paenibacillus sp. LjRoot153]|uniref:toxin-antitoxin system HicB family antitoxin n=1 Tax=Paenibacillus sp. LjRoot153 TaxID=3342270 RepID=UPI003ECF631F